MKIRLWGLPEENDQVTEALRKVFRVVDASDDYLPNRGDSPLRRRYLELRLGVDAETSQQE